MDCPLKMIHGKDDVCILDNCAIWDGDKLQCLIKSYFQSAVKQAIFASQGMRMVERVNRELDNRETEDDSN